MTFQGHKFNEYYYNKHGRYKSFFENPVFIENNFEVILHHRGMIAMVNFRRVVMGYRKNHNSITGPTWKYPRLVI